MDMKHLGAATVAGLVLTSHVTPIGQHDHHKSDVVYEAIHTPTVRAGRAGARDFARSLLALRGFGSGQYQCLNRLWHRESRWNPNSRNKRTGAYGIPQRIDGYGKPYMDDYRGQIVWGIGYITNRYGTPCAALQHQLKRGWY